MRDQSPKRRGDETFADAKDRCRAEERPHRSGPCEQGRGEGRLGRKPRASPASTTRRGPNRSAMTPPSLLDHPDAAHRLQTAFMKRAGAADPQTMSREPSYFEEQCHGDAHRVGSPIGAPPNCSPAPPGSLTPSGVAGPFGSFARPGYASSGDNANDAADNQTTRAGRARYYADQMAVTPPRE